MDNSTLNTQNGYYVVLSPIDRVILESFMVAMEGLAEYLGPGCEMVLHCLEDLDHSAIKVINGYHSGRTEGAPITDLALQMLAHIKEDTEEIHSTIYFNHTYRGIPIRSATIPILGEKKRIIGLLCVNFYLDMPVYTFIAGMIGNGTHEKNIIENFSEDTNEIILSALEKTYNKVIKDPTISATNRNKEMISELERMGIFKLKNSVAKVSEFLNISKNTVYLHIRNMNSNE